MTFYSAYMTLGSAKSALAGISARGGSPERKRKTEDGLAQDHDTRPDGATPPGRLAAPSDEVVAAMRSVSEASKELKLLFDRLDIAMHRAIGVIESGVPVLELAQSMNLPGRREALNEAAARARAAQHALLRSLFRAAEAEGATKADIARTWRVSRQLVSRMVKERR